MFKSSNVVHLNFVVFVCGDFMSSVSFLTFSGGIYCELYDGLKLVIELNVELELLRARLEALPFHFE